MSQCVNGSKQVINESLRHSDAIEIELTFDSSRLFCAKSHYTFLLCQYTSVFHALKILVLLGSKRMADFRSIRTAATLAGSKGRSELKSESMNK